MDRNLLDQLSCSDCREADCAQCLSGRKTREKRKLEKAAAHVRTEHMSLTAEVQYQMPAYG